eukprot:snap_masked-scaffold_10-processed-gene-3.23-mRNA-1 protein AED:1.00 eAED:1.00 QI:0/-1/0/0/-1/1/1/0/105
MSDLICFKIIEFVVSIDPLVQGAYAILKDCSKLMLRASFSIRSFAKCEALSVTRRKYGLNPKSPLHFNSASTTASDEAFSEKVNCVFLVHPSNTTNMYPTVLTYK